MDGMDSSRRGLLLLHRADAGRHDRVGAPVAEGDATGLAADPDDARRPPVHRPDGRGLGQPRLRRVQREGDDLVQPGAGTVDLDQPGRVDAAARAHHPKRLTDEIESRRRRILPSRSRGRRREGTQETKMKYRMHAVAFAAAALALGQAAWAGEAEAKKWIDSEFQPSTLNKDQQMAEM